MIVKMPAFLDEKPAEADVERLVLSAFLINIQI